MRSIQRVHDFKADLDPRSQNMAQFLIECGQALLSRRLEHQPNSKHISSDLGYLKLPDRKATRFHEFPQ